jgi:hypothetical protein
VATGGLVDRSDIGGHDRVGHGIRYVFAAFAAVSLVGGIVTLLFAIETKGRVLEELSP